MSAIRNLALGLLICSLALAACSDPIPSHERLDDSEAAPSSGQASEHSAQPAPAAQPDPDRPPNLDIYSYQDARTFAERMLQVLDQERAWCDQQPEVAGLKALLEDHDPEDVWRSLLIPVEGEDLRAVEIIAEATADARGIPMQTFPPVFLISRTSLRHNACLTEEVWEASNSEHRAGKENVGKPASRLALMIGQETEAYGEREQTWLSSTLAWGWYDEIAGADDLAPGQDGPGQMVIVSSPSMPASFATVISHELIHFLQDQWVDWRLHDWFRDSSTTDQLQVVRWVVEGDAALNQLYGDVSPLMDLLADVEWGPYAHSEYNLWYRAVQALSPEDSANLFAAYDRGSAVFAELRSKDGQAAIDELLLNPPSSSEQLIHADKLESNEQPITLVDLQRLRAEVLPEAQWQEPIVDRMGEQWIGSLINTATKRPDIARQAATGWGSDQMALWQSRNGETEVVTWQIVFDDHYEHQEGVSGLRRWFYSHTANEAEPVYANMLGWDGPTSAARLITRPNAVWLVASNDADIAADVASDIRGRVWTNYWSRP